MAVGIVGLGLIGGSMAKASRCARRTPSGSIDLDAETMTLSRVSAAPLTAR
ncbi:MAG: hypothetical protein R2881_10190 [Eubacteriales bacterium]